MLVKTADLIKILEQSPIFKFLNFTFFSKISLFTDSDRKREREILYLLVQLPEWPEWP